MQILVLPLARGEILSKFLSSSTPLFSLLHNGTAPVHTLEICCKGQRLMCIKHLGQYLIVVIITYLQLHKCHFSAYVGS